MSTASLIEKYTWSADSESRNGLTAVYEPVQPFILLAMARRLRDAIFVDAGANVGFYTVVIGSEPMITEVLVFEPMPEAASAARWNVQANLAAKAVAVHQVALSAEPGTLQFAVRGPLAGDNGALQDTILDSKDFAIREVRCDRLDDLVSAVGREIVLKIDVEGHELSLLKGAAQTLVDNYGFMQIEMHESQENEEKEALLNGLGWYQVAKVRSDRYFTNVPAYTQKDSFKAEILEEAMGLMIDASKGKWRESRRRIAPGVHLLIDRKRVDAVKKLLRR